jgi:tRNA threonylcarbamoyladenosine modification (KEOPS) complex Cgi121 subunit
MKVQSLITPFINDKLNLKETEEFIDHVQSCPECREELEVYYALLTAMKQLDEDKNLSDDFSMELSAKLEKAQEKIIHAKFTYYLKKGVLLLVIILIAFFFSIRYSANRIEEEELKSNYRLRISFRQDRFDIYENLLQLHLDGTGVYQE